MDVDEVKQYLRIDTDADDELLEIMIDAAKDYIKNAVGWFDEENPRMKLCFFALMQELYEQRVYSIQEANKRRLAYAIGSMILQLQLEEGELHGG